MKYRTFCAGLLADYDEELKAFVKMWRFSMHFSDKGAKIGGAESFEEIRYMYALYGSI